MAKRSTRKRIIYQIEGMANDLDKAAKRTEAIMGLSAGRPEAVVTHCMAIQRVIAELLKVVASMERLYRGSPDLSVPNPEDP